MMSSFVRTIYATLLLLSLSSVTSAQVNSSSITGSVTDPKEAPVPGAQVMASQLATGLTRETVTNSQGSYVLDDLPVGLYNIKF